MRRGKLVLCLAWIAAGVSAYATADAQDDPSRARKDFSPRPIRKAGARFRGDVKAWVKSLKLPKEQEKKLLADVQRWQAQQEAAEKAHAARAKELAGQMKPVLKHQEQLRSQMRELQADRDGLAAEAKGQVAPHSLATQEQLRAWEGHRLYRSLSQQYRRAKLTADQQDRLQKLCDTEAKKLASAAPDRRAETDRQVRDHLARGLDRLLTDDQHETMAAGRLEDVALRSMQGVRLTNEQYEKVQGLCAEAAGKLRRAAGTDAKAARQWGKLQAQGKGIFAELAEGIRGKVLTAEQRKQLEAARKAKDTRRGAKPPDATPWWKKLFGG